MKPVECGTARGALRHYLNGEPACRACLDAANARHTAWRRSKGIVERKVAECGTIAGHHRHRRVDKSPPCDACRTAWNAYLRSRTAAKR